MKKSKWFFWSFVPFFNFAAWIHAAIRTGRNSYYWLTAVYAVPFTIALVTGMAEENLGLTKETVERVTDLGSTAAVVLWIAGMIHVLLKKDSIDRQIQAHDDGKMQVGRVVSNSPPQLSEQILAAGLDSPQPRTQDAAPSTTTWQSPAIPETKAVLESRIGMPQTISLATKEGERASKFPPKIGKRGWCGVVIVIIGLGTVIGANKSAGDLIKNNWTTFGSSRVFEDEALAKAAGYNSYSDYLAGQNRTSGVIFSVFGFALVVWGYSKYNSKKNTNKQK
jgi:hypothetical protein